MTVKIHFVALNGKKSSLFKDNLIYRRVKVSTRCKELRIYDNMYCYAI